MAIAPKFEANISADISKFMRNMATVDKRIKELASGVAVDIKADISGFMQRAATVQTTIETIANNSPTVTIDANTAGFVAQAATVEAVAAAVGSLEPTVTVEADTAAATAQVTGFMAVLRAITAQNLVVRIRASWANYQSVMGAMAAFSRNFSEITGMVGRGITIAMSPAIVPVLASVVGLLGNLGPMLGTIAGSSFALVGAFAAAGLGAAGFAAVAAPSIGGVIKRAEELKKLEEKIAKADTWEERNKLMKEQSAIMDGMSGAQKRADKALTAFKDNYKELVTSMESQVLKVFEGGLKAITGVLSLARPMIRNATEAIGFLMDAFNRNLEAQDVKDFFTFLAKSAGPALITVGKAVGNFMMGLFNMFTAFAPLSVDTQNSFLAMSESFRKWADGLSESKKFQAFIDYTKENMPKIRSIFSDAIQGMINMFGGFGGSSSDMMTSLQNLMERFKNFSSTISENQGFQKFIDYIKTNGPVVVSAIGEIITLITNLGIAAAPMGEKMLGIIESMTNFANEMLKAHPWLGKLAVGAVVLTGAFLAALPVLVGLNALLGGFITKMILATAKTIWGATVQVAKWILMGVTATLNAIKIAAAWTLATGIAMVTAVAKMIASAVIFIARWTLMGVQALLHAAKVAAAWTLATGIAMVTAVAKMVATAAVFVAKWLWMGAQALFHAAKVAAAWLLTTGASMAVALAGMVATAAVFVAKWVWMAVQSLAQAARMAAAWFIAMGPVGWVIGAIVGLAILIIANWDKISAWTKKTWSTVSNWIKEKWSEIKSKTSEAASKMLSTIITKFAQIVSSIREKMASAKSNISSKWEEIKAAAAAKLANLVTTVITFFARVVSKIREKMGEAVRVLGQKVGEMPGKVLSFFGKMLSAGSDLVRGLINGIKNMGGAAVEAISGVVGGVISKAKSLLNINSPSRVFSEFGGFISEGLANGVSDKAKLAVNQVANMASAMTSAFNPKLEMANMRASAQLDTSVSRADMGVVRKSFAAEIDSGEKQEQAIYVNNEIVGDKILTVVNRGQAKQSRLTDGFYGK